MTSLNQQFEQIRQSATVAMADRILALKAAGEPIIGLQVGDPDFGTPPAVLDAAFKAMQGGLTHYGSSRGYPDLRQAILPSCDAMKVWPTIRNPRSS
jgi:aspartate/methionine/tyrosine aminotransferase